MCVLFVIFHGSGLCEGGGMRGVGRREEGGERTTGETQTRHRTLKTQRDSFQSAFRLHHTKRAPRTKRTKIPASGRDLSTCSAQRKRISLVVFVSLGTLEVFRLALVICTAPHHLPNVIPVSLQSRMAAPAKSTTYTS